MSSSMNLSGHCSSLSTAPFMASAQSSMSLATMIFPFYGTSLSVDRLIVRRVKLLSCRSPFFSSNQAKDIP
ncbi:hypothetical protein VTN49DRAFT_7242 [Thermomyces lanuginosus]|uniref:uncharacterized protein n=1 Tax=Thermomyces lanuginosus TaxID=5541 RepID=UPI0037430FA5